MNRPSSSKRASVASGSDRLSALPDELLHSVMSFLTARQAVQTSALSRRWRDLWCFMPCLDIDHGDFWIAPAATVGGSGDAAAAAPRHVNSSVAWRRLENFTANLLMYHRAPVLDRFRLLAITAPSDREMDAVDRWLRRGTRYRPVVLEVTMPSMFYKIGLPPMGPASRMKRMHLCRVKLGGSFADHLRSRCPVLEDLELKECDFSFLEIVSATLKRLAIESSLSWHYEHRLSVMAPRLASLWLVFPQLCTDQDVFLVNGAEFLLQASISGCLRSIGKNLFRVLGSLCNVRTLKLWSFSYPTAKLPNVEKEMFPKLNNLTTLVMEECDMTKQFDILQLFLQNVPSLEKVTLHHCMYTQMFKKKGALRKVVSPPYRKLISFESQDLKLIEIKDKDGNTSSLFRLLMGIRRKLNKNTVVLIKEKGPTHYGLGLAS